LDGYFAHSESAAGLSVADAALVAEMSGGRLRALEAGLVELGYLEGLAGHDHLNWPDFRAQ